MLKLEDLIRPGDRPDYFVRSNLETVLLPRVQRLLFFYRQEDHEEPEVSRGYSTPEHNAEVGGKKGSLHLQGLAVDFRDPKGVFGKWCLGNIEKLELCGLYLEDPRATPEEPHVHLDCKARVHTVFLP
jgi:hypothetical protein